jgi:hypothetical protein
MTLAISIFYLKNSRCSQAIRRYNGGSVMSVENRHIAHLIAELRNVDSIMPRISPSPPTPLPTWERGARVRFPFSQLGLGEEGRPKHGISEVI